MITATDPVYFGGATLDQIERKIAEASDNLASLLVDAATLRKRFAERDKLPMDERFCAKGFLDLAGYGAIDADRITSRVASALAELHGRRL